MALSSKNLHTVTRSNVSTMATPQVVQMFISFDNHHPSTGSSAYRLLVIMKDKSCLVLTKQLYDSQIH